MIGELLFIFLGVGAKLTGWSELVRVAGVGCAAGAGTCNGCWDTGAEGGMIAVYEAPKVKCTIRMVAVVRRIASMGISRIVGFQINSLKSKES